MLCGDKIGSDERILVFYVQRDQKNSAKSLKVTFSYINLTKEVTDKGVNANSINIFANTGGSSTEEYFFLVA